MLKKVKFMSLFFKSVKKIIFSILWFILSLIEDIFFSILVILYLGFIGYLVISLPEYWNGAAGILGMFSLFLIAIYFPTVNKWLDARKNKSKK